MHEFDRDTQVLFTGGEGAAGISEHWSIGQVPNGGYVMAVGARALLQALDRPDPLTVTGHYLNPTQPGAAKLELDLGDGGRRLATGGVKLIQDGLERARFVLTGSDFARHRGMDWGELAAPDLPPPAACRPTHLDAQAPHPFHSRVEVRVDPACGDWRSGGAREAEMRGWLSFVDGRPPDALALLLFADSMPPPIFRVLGQCGWVPTVELTVQVRARPAPGPIAGVFRTRHLTGGLLEEDGRLWDSSGRLVAISRQLALLRSGQPRRPEE